MFVKESYVKVNYEMLVMQHASVFILFSTDLGLAFQMTLIQRPSPLEDSDNAVRSLAPTEAI
jgi:hypothetical protein